MTIPAFPPLCGAQEGDQIYLRAGHTTAQLQVQVRRGQEIWQGELQEDGWHLYPVGGVLQGQPYGTVRRSPDGVLVVKLTGLQILPLSPPQTGAEKRKNAPRQQQAQRRPARDDMRRATPADREEVRNFRADLEAAAAETERRRAAAAQPTREQGWPERVRAVQTWDQAVALVDEIGARIPSASTRLAVEEQLVTHLVQGPQALLQRATAQDLRLLGALAVRLAQAPAKTLMLAIGARQIELEPRVVYQGGEERLGDGCE